MPSLRATSPRSPTPTLSALFIYVSRDLSDEALHMSEAGQWIRDQAHIGFCELASKRLVIQSAGAVPAPGVP